METGEQGQAKEGTKTQGHVSATGWNTNVKASARDIYSASQGFHAAGRMLWEPEPEKGKPFEPKLFPAYAMCMTFELELLLKSMLIDQGSPTIPASHDLSLLFSQLGKRTREKLTKQFKLIEQARQGHLIGGPKLEDYLSMLAVQFERWRYHFEYGKGEFDLFGLLFNARDISQCFSEHLLEAHPDWKDADGSYYRSTFPFP